MQKRKLGRSTLEVSAIGLGCMGMSFAYGTPEERDEQESIATLHRAYLNGNRRKIGSKRANAFGQIIAARKLWMLAGDKKNLTKSLAGKMLCFGHYFVDIKRDAEDRIIA